MLSGATRDERDANLFADIASAHDAGLTTDQILLGPATATLDGLAAPGTDLVAGLVAKGVILRPHERVSLDAAASAGRIGQALRILAERRLDRAERVRSIRGRLLYPSGLCAFGLLTAVFGATVTGNSPWTPLLVLAAVAIPCGLLYRYAAAALDRPNGTRIPLVSPLLANLGELPYLQAMHGLYAAGVNLVEAHETATRTTPTVAVRSRLEKVGKRLAAGATYSESIEADLALHSETRQMLASAEKAGDLEDALARAIERRQFATDRQIRALTSVGTTTVIVLVYGYLAWVILSFWSNYYGNLPI